MFRKFLLKLLEPIFKERRNILLNKSAFHLLFEFERMLFLVNAEIIIASSISNL